MSTILIDTTGRSLLKKSTNVVPINAKGESDIAKALNSLNVSLNNDDSEPDLTPASSSGIIDVVTDFSWYAGPPATVHALNRVPCAFLIERKQLLSSLISGSLYYLNAGANTLADIANKKDGLSDFLTSTLGKIGESVNGTLDGAASFATAAKNFTNNYSGSKSDISLLENNNLKSLQGIYFTKPTGFYYRLPMFDQKITTSTEWGSDHPNSFIGMGTGAVQKGVDTFANLVNFAQPGTYIENPRYFQGIGERVETITFPLANTIQRGNHSPVQQNYELLWLLAFQNKAYKTSFSRIQPPKIYSINVPGQFSMPYAYISKMTVNFVGTTRKQTVFIPSGGKGNQYYLTSKPIQVPVPEAYQVELEFTSLIKDYGNTMLGTDFSTAIDEDGTVRWGVFEPTNL